MKNPLIKRLPRELKGEIGKYIVLFLFITMMIGIVSGFLVAAGSMSVAYDESFEKYNIESGNFELLQKADDDAIIIVMNKNRTMYFPISPLSSLGKRLIRGFFMLTLLTNLALRL